MNRLRATSHDRQMCNKTDIIDRVDHSPNEMDIHYTDSITVRAVCVVCPAIHDISAEGAFAEEGGHL